MRGRRRKGGSGGALTGGAAEPWGAATTSLGEGTPDHEKHPSRTTGRWRPLKRAGRPAKRTEHRGGCFSTPKRVGGESFTFRRPIDVSTAATHRRQPNSVCGGALTLCPAGGMGVPGRFLSARGSSRIRQVVTRTTVGRALTMIGVASAPAESGEKGRDGVCPKGCGHGRPKRQRR